MNMYEDYLMLLSPPATLKNKISVCKVDAAQLIGAYPSMNSPAHISIQHLERQKPFMTDRSLELLEQKLNKLPPILLHADGFRYFSHLHKRLTIYNYLRLTPIVDEWFKELKLCLKIKKTLVPHITITRNITEDDFKILWPHFRHKKLDEPFIISELKILKRESFSSSAKWEAFKSFEFKNHLSKEIDPTLPSIKQTKPDDFLNNQFDLF